MERHVSIDEYLFIDIKGLPIEGEEQEQYLDDKTKGIFLVEEMKKKYGTERGS